MRRAAIKWQGTTMRDLGLDYEAAGHGIQSAIRFEMSKLGIADDQYSALIRFIKHMRVAVDMRASDQQALATLLIKKGVITTEEYTEAMRRGPMRNWRVMRRAYARSMACQRGRCSDDASNTARLVGRRARRDAGAVPA
jgi:hypothetical protein